ncbi:octicosapeptide/Phox/Bem1p family protein [Actinidia rufa]|uniref:Octicosapeptide/Phox/Bem1p family protein n=1 Tax=Actinidia rufa TaxID=165716 RepID=A0A7J0GFS1_9ERIC|nr:octicosapeptide/Phox/Bem1p family protein [Actinidia rufa]
MAVEEVSGRGGGTDTEIAAALGLGSGPESPKNKVKFMCSHGGKILPRHTDGLLKYVGGETRIVSVPRDINFSELMKKLASISGGDIVLKYQLIPEDLDALVTVKSDADLHHMIDEHDRYETAGTPMLRAFLFPATPIVLENQINCMEPHAIEQRYIDAVNGIIRAATTAGKHRAATGNPSPTGLSSTSSSPKSPESCNIDSAKFETFAPNGFQKSRLHMHKVHSSPSLSTCLSSPHPSTTAPVVHQHHQQYQQTYQQLHQHGCQSPKAQATKTSHQHGCQSPRLVSVRSVGRNESWKYQVVPGPGTYHPMPIARHNRGGRCSCSKCLHLNEYGACVNRKGDRGGSPFRSPPLTRNPS